MIGAMVALGMMATGGCEDNMADFVKALKRTMVWEGGYSKDIRDSGGETFKGISRVHFPDWEGWEVIDRMTEGTKLHEVPELQNAVENFYLTNFWNRVRGSSINDCPLAEAMFDAAVNMGVHQSVKFAQSAVNILRAKGKVSLTEELVVDGQMGDLTVEALNRASAEAADALLKMYGAHRMNHYGKLVVEYPKNTVFLKGWQRRACAFLDGQEA